MRRTQRVRGWGIIVAVLFCLGMMTSVSRGASSYVPVTITDLPFNMVVRELVKERGGAKGLFLYEEVSTRVSVNDNGSTSLDALLAGLSAQVGLAFRQDDTTYYIGKPEQLAQRTSNPTNVLGPVPGTNPPAVPDTPNAVRVPEGSPIASSSDAYVIRTVQLNNISASEIAWMLGYKSTGTPSRQRRDRLSLNLRSVLDPRRPVVGNSGSGASYDSPALQNYYNNQRSYSDARVFPPINPPINPPIDPFPPINPPINPIDPTPPINPIDPNNPTGTPGGVLRNFIPDGIQDVVGIESLNQLFVRATNEEAVQQFVALIAMLDKPVKQAILEVMFVKMTILDAMNLTTNWSVSSAPWNLVNQVGAVNPDTPLTITYVNGNIKAALGALVSTSKAKVVNAPRIIVQNGGDAYISLGEKIPFVIVSTTEDIYGRQIATPVIEIQEISQDLDVTAVTIHPDDSVELDLNPVMSDPTSGISLRTEGGDDVGIGSISGTSDTEVSTRIRVRNGETALLGGFVSSNESNSITKVPLLGDIPILGPLFFRSTSKANSSTQTLIFFTPTVIKDDPTEFPAMTSLPPIF